MINKDYQYFNGENITIENSIVSKTSDIFIKGRTLMNIHPKSIYRFNAPSSEGNKYTQDKSENSVIANITEEITSWCYVDCGVINRDMFKPNTKYTIIGEFNGIESVSLMDGTAQYSMTNQVAFNNNRAVVQIKSAEEINRIPNDIRIIIYCYNKKTVGTVSAKNVMILEGDWTNKPIPSYFESIKSFGQQEDKISTLSRNKNLFKDYNTNIKLYKGQNLYLSSIFTEGANRIDILCDDASNLSFKGDRFYYRPVEKLYRLSNDMTTLIAEITVNKDCEISFSDKYFNVHYKEIQLEEGTQRTSYNKYKEDKKDILLNKYNIDNGLKGINNVNDEINNKRIIIRIGEERFKDKSY